MTPALDVRGLSFAFDDGLVLQDINLAVQDGERVGIVGANGAGKSTLLWCLLGLLKGTGEIRVAGRPPARHDGTAVGAVFQNPEDQLFMPRLIDDLTLPLINQGMPAPEAASRALDTLASFGLLFAANRPASRLSLGERKRAALASALVTRPQIIVLDEPTAELDGRAVRQLAGVFDRLTVTLLVASHDLEFLRRVTSRVVVLIDGRIAADGPSATLLADRTLLERAGVV